MGAKLENSLLQTSFVVKGVTVYDQIQIFIRGISDTDIDLTYYYVVVSSKIIKGKSNVLAPSLLNKITLRAESEI